VWDLTTREQIGLPQVLPMPVCTLALGPQGRLMVGFGHDVAVLTRRG
jgi:hypothetical protein